jgi:hypothetical protein
MTLSFTTIAPTVFLTTVARAKEGAGITTSADDALLDRLVRAASAAIVSHCGRPFAREAYTESLPGFGSIHLELSRTPVITVSAVTQDGNVITDYEIADRDQGLLYRRRGWDWTAQAFPGLSGSGLRFMDMGTPLPRQEEPSFSVSSVCGYILPPQFRLSVATLFTLASDNSFNDSAGLFPALLKAGDVVEALGFTDPANLGRFVVTGTPTVSKIPVSATLVAESAAAGRSTLFHPPAGCRPFDDVEAAAIETVKSWYLGRKEDSNVVEKALGPARLRVGEDESSKQGLPPLAARLLRPWVRAA